MSTAEQKRLWRLANPEKVAAENERRRLRKRELKAAKADAPVIKRKRKAATLQELPPEKSLTKPVNANDPPELIELFRKAAKGQPPRPVYPNHRKFSVFKLRGVAR